MSPFDQLKYTHFHWMKKNCFRVHSGVPDLKYQYLHGAWFKLHNSSLIGYPLIRPFILFTNSLFVYVVGGMLFNKESKSAKH